MDTAQPPISASANSDPAPIPSSSQQQPPSPTAPSSPPFADSVVRPFTSQGSTPTQTLAYHYPPPTRSSERPYTAHGTSNPPPTVFGPYMSASARTSYTRVDVDSAPPAMYPALPLPSIPTSSAELNPTSSAVPNNEASESQIPQTPQISLTFLLVSGRRKVQSFDPETTVGRVKELVWNAWPARDAGVGFPTSLPSSPAANPTIVHLSIRPYAPPAEDPALSKKKRLSSAFARRGTATDAEDAAVDGADRAGCCGGCIIC
ncbi:hypothetical protein HYDPIDRAFT_29201 [Hydnomerulius pinastri MD-312]|uniref:UBL3-like ubiquitin domain-containing protein n=1 Tax=Hydnomerulius pinastri MD-312 TaxID=994086 RepID=A0A0C9WED6_9AGAM|nr:hypothetical protein HYDPIDRAFT_29201 [Hydnomerulius pinastri MD-312]